MSQSVAQNVEISDECKKFWSKRNIVKKKSVAKAFVIFLLILAGAESLKKTKILECAMSY